MDKDVGFVMRPSGLNARAYHILTVRICASDFISQCVDFLIYEMGIIIIITTS